MNCSVVIISLASIFETKEEAAQQRSFFVANKIVLNQISGYEEQVYADTVVSNFLFMKFFSSLQNPKIFANISSNIVSQVHTRKSKTRWYICKVKPNFLRSLWHIN